MIEVSTEPGPGTESRRNRWHRVTLALLAGLVTASLMFFLIAAVQTPGLDPPPESAALFVVVTTAGVVSYHLLRGGDTVGYPAAMLTGGFVLVVLGLVATGTYGPVGPRTNPVGPLSYVALAVAVVVAAGLAWRTGPVTETSTPSQSTP